MFVGDSNTTMVKRATATQQATAVGFQKTKFAHKATAAQAVINLASLTVPPEMTVNGFANPTSAQLLAANLLFNRKNLKLWSSLRGDMVDYYQYSVSSSGTITLVGYTADEGEIFEGTIDYVAVTGNNIAATIAPPAAGNLAAGTTDFNTGFPFQVNANSTQQVGNVLVYRNGQIQVRNSGNATAGVSVVTGDYQEVDAGGGTGQIIRFNRPDPDNDATVVVVPNGRLLELPSGSMMATIEFLNGQINNMAAYVAAMAGQTTTTILGSSPTNTDLKVFGDRVIALEANRARLDIANTFLGTNTFNGVTNLAATTNIAGRTDGSNPATGYIGEILTFSFTGGPINTVTLNTPVDAHSFTLPPGVWLLVGTYTILANWTSAITTANSVVVAVQLTTNANGLLTQASGGLNPWVSASQASSQNNHLVFVYPLTTGVSTPLKVRLVCSQSAAGAVAQMNTDGTTFLSGTDYLQANVKAIRVG